MESYLIGRKQFGSVSGTYSMSLDMKFGVLKGSILGPLLLIIYINDIPETANVIITLNALFNDSTI